MSAIFDFAIKTIQYSKYLALLGIIYFIYKTIIFVLGRLRKIPKLILEEPNHIEERPWAGRKWNYYNVDIKNTAYLKGILLMSSMKLK